jgi:hypothetical protein
MPTLINSFSLSSTIGIGTDFPNKALTVVGDISATGNVYSLAGTLGTGGGSSTAGALLSTQTGVFRASAADITFNSLSTVGSISAAAITLNTGYVYGSGPESVFTDGSNIYGNGPNTLTMNYTSGVFINSSLYLSSVKLPSALYLYDPTGVRWQLTVTTSGILSTVRA